MYQFVNPRLGVLMAAGLLSAGTAYGALVGLGSSDGANAMLYKQLGFASNNDVQVGPTGKQIAADQVWSTSIGSLFGTMLIEIAGNAAGNNFGVYDIANVNNRLTVFPGADGVGSAETLVISGSTISVGANSIVLAGTQFGFYLAGPGGTFYSQSSRNPNGKDQMITFLASDVPKYTGSGWILAFEDLPYGSSDKDFNDLVVSISTVPEPSTILAGALLLLPIGLSAARGLRRREDNSAE